MIQPYMTSRTKQKITDKTTWTKIRKSELINDKCVDMYSWLTFPSWTTRLYLFHVWIYRRKIKLFFSICNLNVFMEHLKVSDGIEVFNY